MKNKRIITFVDNSNIRWTIEAEITNRNGYSEFTISGEGNGSCGQCYDSIIPDNEEQEKLLDLWSKYHLQNLNNFKEIDIDEFWKTVENLCDEIEDAELYKKEGRLIIDIIDEDGEDAKELFEDYDNEQIALAYHLNLSRVEMDDISKSKYGYGDCLYTCQGTDYYCGEWDDICVAEEEYLEQMIEECYLYDVPEPAKNYIDIERWVRDWSGNWSENLNGYDGNGYEVTINNITYYICRT